MHNMRYVGKVEDEFVFTRNDDIVMWSREEGRERIETNLEQLDVAILWSDGVLVAGDGDEFLHLHADRSIELMYDGPYTHDISLSVIDIVEYAGEITLYLENGLTSVLIGENWGMYIGV